MNMYMYMYMYMYMCMCICVCVYIYIVAHVVAAAGFLSLLTIRVVLYQMTLSSLQYICINEITCLN